MSQKLDWQPQGGIAALVHKNGRKLALIVSNLGCAWSVMAIEGGGEDDGIDGVLADHAHDMVAREVPLEAALRLAETYAEAWLSGDAEALEKCKCPTIRAPEMGPDGELELEPEPQEPSKQYTAAYGTRDYAKINLPNEFHLHLEKCEQCREHPFALCTKGLVLLREEVAP